MTTIPEIRKQILETLDKEIEERVKILPTLVGWLYQDITKTELYKLRMIRSDIIYNKHGF